MTIRRICPTIFFCLIGIILFLSNQVGHAKEIEATKEWQLLGENDTIPAGMHVRMDMTTGEKWVKQIDENESETEQVSTTAAAVIQEDGSVQVTSDGDSEKPNRDSYNYEVMHRTLSQLPDEEKERMGGLPELPQSKGSTPLSKKEREAFEKRMAEIWKKRQEELMQLQEQMLDLPEVLKERIKSIREYLADPLAQLKNVDLENDNDDVDDDDPSHFVAMLQDLEFLLTDIDMARDFHTLGGWALLVSLIAEETHVPKNTTISRLSRRTEEKIRAVQAHAAWAVGTAVKNTGEFFPLAIEAVPMENSKMTTAIDLLIDVFCKDYEDNKAWGVRTLLAKSVYGIGALLRGNRLAQARISETDAPTRLGGKLRELSLARFSSANTKLVQRLISLAADVVSDVTLHGDELDSGIKNSIIRSFSSEDWCESLVTLLTTDTFLPVHVQETLLESVIVMSPHCAWDDKIQNMEAAITTMQQEWQNNKNDFDSDHLAQITGLADRAQLALKEA